MATRIVASGEASHQISSAQDVTNAPAFSAEQFRMVLATIASRADTLLQALILLEDLDQKQDQWTYGVMFQSAQVLARSIGAMADPAVGGIVVGDADRWNYGRAWRNLASEASHG